MNLSKVQHTTLSSKRIFDYFKTVDNSFIPKLSEVVNLKEYALKLSKSAEHFVCFDSNRSIAGLVAEKKDYYRMCKDES